MTFTARFHSSSSRMVIVTNRSSSFDG